MSKLTAWIGIIDRWLAGGLPDAVRIAGWGTLAGMASFALYVWLSPQGKLAASKARLRDLRRSLANPNLAFPEFMKLSRENLRVSMGYMGLVIGPALVSVLPVLVMAAWLHETYPDPVQSFSLALAWEWIFFVPLGVVAIAGRLLFRIH